MATRVLRPLKRAFLCIPPECLTACKIWRGLKIFISQDFWFLQRLVLNALGESRCKSKAYKTRKQSFYLVCTLTFLPCQFHSLLLFNFKKQFSLTREVNLKLKEFNCEKAGFRAIHTENDADMFISWRRIINDATDFSTHQWNFLASIAFQGISSTKNLEISILLQQILGSIILNETAKTKSVKIY